MFVLRRASYYGPQKEAQGHSEIYNELRLGSLRDRIRNEVIRMPTKVTEIRVSQQAEMAVGRSHSSENRRPMGQKGSWMETTWRQAHPRKASRKMDERPG